MTPYQIQEAERKAAAEAALAWRKSLKPGDEFAVPTRSWANSKPYQIYKVERLTATQIITEREIRFRIADGYMLGSSSGRQLVEITPAIREELEAYTLHTWLAELVKKPMPLGLLRALKTAHDEVAK